MGVNPIWICECFFGATFVDQGSVIGGRRRLWELGFEENEEEKKEQGFLSRKTHLSSKMELRVQIMANLLWVP